MNFIEFYNQPIVERRFRDSHYLTHVIDVQGFSVFVHEDVGADMNISRSKMIEIFNKVLKHLSQFGFPKMHLNVVINDLSNHKAEYAKDNASTSTTGMAHGSRPPPNVPYPPESLSTTRKYITIDRKRFEALDDTTVSTLVHEYAHVFFFNKSKAFKTAVIDLFKEIKNVDSTTINKHNNNSNNPVQSATVLKPENYKLLQSKAQLLFKNMVQYFFAGIESGLQGKDIYRGIIKMVSNFIERSGTTLAQDPQIQQEISTRSTEYAKAFYSTLVKNYKNFPVQSSTEIASLDPQEIINFLTPIWFAYDVPNIIEIISDIFSVYKIQKSESFNDSAIQQMLQAVNNWPTQYGMANKDEMFATAIQYFWKLPLDIKKRFIRLMMEH